MVWQKIGKSAQNTLLSLLKSQNPLNRIVAVRGLGEFYNEQSVSALVKALKDPEDTVKYAVVMALAHAGSQKEIQFLEEVKEKD